jgi:hypothetical protein
MPYSPPDRIADALGKRKYDLLEAIGHTVTESFQRAIQANGRKPDEVRMFSSFFYLGLPALQRRLNDILHEDKIRATICGVFCHQTPVVHYSPPVGKGSCELADITFIVTYGGKLKNNGLGNAVMMQAKLSEADIRKQKVQTGLYQQGIRFRYSAIKSYGADERYRREIQDSIFALDELERVVNAAAIRREIEIENAKQRFVNILRAREQVIGASSSLPSWPKSPQI